MLLKNFYYYRIETTERARQAFVMSDLEEGKNQVGMRLNACICNDFLDSQNLTPGSVKGSPTSKETGG